MLHLSISIQNFVSELLEWYDQNKRELPWRSSPLPYNVWVSEIMLQQTQVQTVLPYYERFMSAFPTIRDLAQADLQQVHKLWEGLGYYRRATNLHQAAQKIVSEFNGYMPEEYHLLRQLPGIGDYTAGAIASIAFGQRTCAVDGNVLRILSRLTLFEEPINDPKSVKPLKDLAQTLVPAHRPGDFNQAMMDLGASHCRANGVPTCRLCPIQNACLAFKKDCTTVFPIKKSKKPRQIENRTILLLRADNTLYIQQREKNALLGGLWEYLNLPGHLSENNVHTWLKEHHAVYSTCQSIGKSRHIFTHKEWHMIGYLIDLKSRLPLSGRWVTLKELQDTYPIPTALAYFSQKILDYE